MKNLYLLSLLLGLPLLLHASVTVRGVVTQASDGEPVIGASVLELGTSNGTITDIDGAYELTVGDNATLEVSYVGLKTQKVKVTGSQMNIVMQDDAIAVEEVVVTAMGIVQEKKRMNFAVQNIAGESLTENKSANFVNSLQGKVAGVQVTNGGGSPNSGSQIIIRGISSVNTSKSNEPLFILDGMPISGGATAAADINPNDIENVTILKGAAAAALYGQDAANGVITTAPVAPAIATLFIYFLLILISSKPLPRPDLPLPWCCIPSVPQPCSSSSAWCPLSPQRWRRRPSLRRGSAEA